jgi:translation initiation factor IF-2
VVGQVVGGKVESGMMKTGALVNISRRGFLLGKGRIVELQSQKIKTDVVNEGTECGLTIESKIEIIPNDTIEAILVEKLKI